MKASGWRAEHTQCLNCHYTLLLLSVLFCHPWLELLEGDDRMVELLTLAFKLRDYFLCFTPNPRWGQQAQHNQILSAAALVHQQGPLGVWEETGLKSFACLCFLKKVQFSVLSNSPITGAKVKMASRVTLWAKCWDCKWALFIYGFPKRTVALSAGRKTAENRRQTHTSNRKRQLGVCVCVGGCQAYFYS